MNGLTEPFPAIRTAVLADLPELRRVYRAASLSNAGDAPLLRGRPELLVFGGEGLGEGRTRLAHGADADGCVLGFATVSIGAVDGAELEDLFVDPAWQRRGVARRLILDAVRSLRRTGHRRLWVTGNPHARAFYSAVGFTGDEAVRTPAGAGLRLHLDLTGR